MASAAGLHLVKKVTELTWESYEQWDRSIKDYVIMHEKTHIGHDGNAVLVPVNDKHIAAVMRQTLEGPALKVLSSLSGVDEEDPAKIKEAVLAACLPNEQAELGDILDEMMVFAQEGETEMEYLMRYDTLKIKVHKLLRERQPDGSYVDVTLPERWWGYVMKRGLKEDLARAVVGSIGTLKEPEIRKAIVGMASGKKASGAAYAAMQQKKDLKCFNCGRFGHMATECQAPKKVGACYNCGKTGHFAKDCDKKFKGKMIRTSEKKPSTFGKRFPTRDARRGRGRGPSRGRGRGRGRGVSQPRRFGPRARAHYANEDGDYTDDYEEYEDEYEDGSEEADEEEEEASEGDQ